jgi:hypothetical protein
MKAQTGHPSGRRSISKSVFVADFSSVGMIKRAEELGLKVEMKQI